MSTSRVFAGSNSPLVLGAVLVTAVVVAIALGRRAPLVAPLGGGEDLGLGHNDITVAGSGSGSDGRSLESGGGALSGSARALDRRGRAAESAGGRSRSSGRVGRGGLGSGGRRNRSSSTVVLRLAGAEGDSDGSSLGAGLHAVGVIGSVAVGLLLGRARRSVGSDLPVTIPGVAVDLAQIVPDGSVVLEGVLVLENVVQGSAVGKLDRPSVSVGELGPLLSVGSISGEGLVDLRVTSIVRRDVGKGNIVVALVDNNSAANRVGGSGGHQGGSSENRVLHFDSWNGILSGFKVLSCDADKKDETSKGKD